MTDIPTKLLKKIYEAKPESLIRLMTLILVAEFSRNDQLTLEALEAIDKKEIKNKR